MAATEVKRISINADYIRSGIPGGIGLDFQKKLRYLHEFRGDDGVFYAVSTTKPVYTQRVRLSGRPSGYFKDYVNDGIFIRLVRCTMKPV